MGLWKEWKESMLEEMLDESFSSFKGMGILGVGFDREFTVNDRCGGAVVARPWINGLGRVGVFNSSSSSSPGPNRAAGLPSKSLAASLLSMFFRVTAGLILDAILSSSLLSDWLDSPVSAFRDSRWLWPPIVASPFRGPSSSSGSEARGVVDCNDLLGCHGRFRIGVVGGSGKSTVNPRLKGHAVTSYWSSFANTSFNVSAFWCSSSVAVGSSTR